MASAAVATPEREGSEPRTGLYLAPARISLQPWLKHLLQYLPIARAGTDPEGVHQVRVACARLLVWLELGGWRVLRDDLRWLRGHAARLRDLDVLRAEDPSAFRDDGLGTELDVARGELLQALDDPRLGSLILALWSMPPVQSRKARAVASRLARVCLRRGRALGARRGSVRALHRLRCAVRRLRFALEWMGAEVPQIVELQEAIGVVCDHGVALRQLEKRSTAKAREEHRSEIERALRRSRRDALRVWRKRRHLLERLA
jgi:CHAD domain-containing protein